MINDEKMQINIQAAENFIDKRYLDNLSEYEVEKLKEYEKNYRFIRLFRILKIVFDKEENSNDKLVSVFHSVLPFCNTLIFLIRGTATYAELYIGVRSTNNTAIASEVLHDSFMGNFPGSQIEATSLETVKEIFDDYDLEKHQGCSISTINVVPSLRNQKENEFVQGLEKFIDTMKGTEYLCEILAEPLSKEATEKRISGFEQLYSSLYPFAKRTMSHGHNEGKTLTEGISESISDSISQGISLASGTTSSASRGISSNYNIGAHMLLGFGFSKGSNEGTSYGTSFNESESRTTSHQSIIGRSRSESNTFGTTDSLTVEYRNKNIDNLLEKTEKHLKRLKEGAAYGIWEGAAYFIANEKKTVAIAASAFSSMLMGEISGIENSQFNIFGNELVQTKQLLEVLRFCRHPRFCIPMLMQKEELHSISAATCINGKEMALLFALPRKSVGGVTVTEMAEFGRNIICRDKNQLKMIHLGHITHMGEVEKRPN